ncbi:MAG: hypothetical protein AAFV43_03395 [Planctomycetota bacterium]
MLLFVACLLALVGCGGSKYDLAKVTGTVTIDGMPYTGKVLFYPARKGEAIVAGRPSYGLPDADGRFTLNCVKPGDGAMVGEHTVTLFVAKDHAEAYPALRALEFNRVPYPLGKVTVSADEPNDIELAFTSEQIRRYGTMR